MRLSKQSLGFVSVFLKKQAETFFFIFSFTKQAENFKTIGAFTESTDLI